MYKWLAVIIILLLLACKQDENTYNVFHYNQVNATNSLDPAFARSQTNIWATHHIYNTLVDLDDSLRIVPSLAKSWDISEDGLTYTFNLRTDVKFHNNKCFDRDQQRIFNADDVAYSFKRLRDPKVNSPGSWVFKNRLNRNEAFKILNDSTFQIILSQPFGPFIGILSMKYCSIVPLEAVETYGNEFRKNPVGTGPLQFKKWKENRGLYLVRNEEYFEGPINYDGVRASYISDKKIAFLELLNQNLDFVSGLESAFIDELLEEDGSLRKDKSELLDFYKSPYLNMEYVGINMETQDNKILLDKNFRKALNYSINKKEMLGILRNNVGKPANSGFIPIGLPAYNDSINMGYSYNLDKAQSHLEASEYDKAFTDPIKIYTNADYLDIITYVSRQWELLGINVEIIQMESSSLRAGMRKGSIDLFRASWIADYPDEENFLSLFYSKNGAPPNYTRFSNDHYDELYEKAIIESDVKKRIELYQMMNQIIIEECPVIFLFYDETALFYSKNVKNVANNGINLLNVKQLNLQN